MLNRNNTFCALKLTHARLNLAGRPRKKSECVRSTLYLNLLKRENKIKLTLTIGENAILYLKVLKKVLKS